MRLEKDRWVCCLHWYSEEGIVVNDNMVHTQKRLLFSFHTFMDIATNWFLTNPLWLFISVGYRSCCGPPTRCLRSWQTLRDSSIKPCIQCGHTWTVTGTLWAYWIWQRRRWCSVCMYPGHSSIAVTFRHGILEKNDFICLKCVLFKCIWAHLPILNQLIWQLNYLNLYHLWSLW